ncbi:MAG TPA: winged helix-turn-helix transcriptional regulator [Candidatus Bathyarchaeia archaeon]|nr:winged helix-turn-helix transcriptional regulator [Candidatus Bathyarchaeia archaeon]
MSTISADDYFHRLHRTLSVLDDENIKIIRTMKAQGPRNLQKIARASKIPYTTVYSRVTKLQSEGLLNTCIHPNFSKIGLSHGILFLTLFPGKEILAREALRVPGYWLKILRCIGEHNGYFVQVAVPSAHTRDYEEFLDQLVVRGVIRSFRVSWLGESRSPLPNFDFYNTKTKTWKFDWKGWLGLFKNQKKRSVLKLAEPSSVNYDKRDLIILKELGKDARTTLVSLAKMLSISLPAAKYRFEGLMNKGLIEDYVISVLPYAPEVSDLSELRLDLRDEAALKRAEEALTKIPFVLRYAVVKGLNSITVRVYLPCIELNNLFAFLSQLVNEAILTSYSYSQLDFMTLQSSTFGYKDYNDGSGWFYDNRKYLDAVDNLLSNWTKGRLDSTPFQIVPVGPMQLF